MSKRIKPLLVVAALVLWGGASAQALAAPGALDTSYGGGTGWSRIDFGSSDQGFAVALQPDGKIVVAGQTNAVDANGDFAVARLNNPQGTIDSGYGGGSGWSRLDFGPGDVATAVALEPGGKIVVAGSIDGAGGAEDFAVARLNSPQGTLDGGYGGGTGWSRLDFGGRDEPKGLALQPDGKILVTGSSSGAGTYDGVVARLNNPQGTLDGGYGGGTGWSRLDFGGADDNTAIALQPDGKIVVAGSTNGAPGSFPVVARLNNPQGTFDGSFGAGAGWSKVDFSPTGYAKAVALQPDGKIVIAGAATTGANSDLAVARINADGTRDNSYGAGTGWSRVSVGTKGVANAVALQRDGKIVVAGEAVVNGSYAIVVARLQPNGLLDSTFGQGGVSIIDLGGTEAARALALQPDGKIVVAGLRNNLATANTDMVVARLENDPGGQGGPAGPGGGKASKPPKCGGKRATIIGTSRNNRLKGTRRADVIVGLGGKDTLRGLGGNDRICGGAGNDKIFGGKGKDRLYGEAGKDTLSGDAGKDRLSGGSGRDRLKGGGGRDVVNGGPGKDRCSGKDKKRSC